MPAASLVTGAQSEHPSERCAFYGLLTSSLLLDGQRTEKMFFWSIVNTARLRLPRPLPPGPLVKVLPTAVWRQLLQTGAWGRLLPTGVW